MNTKSLPKSVERGVSDYLATSRGRKNFASDADYERAEAQSWAILVEALASAGQEEAAGVPEELSVRSRR